MSAAPSGMEQALGEEPDTDPRADQGKWGQPPMAAYVFCVEHGRFYAVGPWHAYITSAFPGVSDEGSAALLAEIQAWQQASNEDMAKFDQLIDGLE